MTDNKSKCFDKEFRLLITQCEETLKEKYKYSLEIGEIPEELLCLRKYKNIYNNMKPEEHYKYFLDVYLENRDNILNTIESDNWLRSDNIEICFGKGIKVLEQKCKLIKIMLSKIYLISLVLREQEESDIEKFTHFDDINENVNSTNLIRPSILLLHLTRIFYYLNNSTDKNTLCKIINSIEDELNITNKTGHSNSTSNSNDTQNNGVFSGMFNMAKTLMDTMGVKTPENMKPPNDEEVSTILNNVFSNKDTQNTLQKIMSSFKDAPNFGSGIQQVLQELSQENDLQNLNSSIFENFSNTTNNNQVDSLDSNSTSANERTLDSLDSNSTTLDTLDSNSTTLDTLDSNESNDSHVPPKHQYFKE